MLSLGLYKNCGTSPNILLDLFSILKKLNELFLKQNPCSELFYIESIFLIKLL